MAILKQTSNLEPDSRYFITPINQKKDYGFLPFYSSLYTGDTFQTLQHIWVDTVFPEFSNHLTKLTKGESRLFIHGSSKGPRSSGPNSGEIKLVKHSDHFSVKIPLIKHYLEKMGSDAVIKRDMIPSLKRLSKTIPEDRLRDIHNSYEMPIQNQLFSADQVLSNFKGSPTAKIFLKKCLVSLTSMTTGGYYKVFIDLEISKAEAEHMVNLPWIEIKSADIYMMLMGWVDHYFGVTGKVPGFSLTVSRIAKGLSKDPGKLVFKINDKGLAVDQKGIPFYLPRECNSTDRYENLLQESGSRDDGSFSLRDINEDDPQHRTLPSNIPVLIDWVNSKFSYTDTSGLLKVQNLSRFRPMNVTHISNVMKYGVSLKRIEQILSLATALGIDHSSFKPTREEVDQMGEVFGNPRKGEILVDMLYRNVSLTDWFKEVEVGYDQAVHSRTEIDVEKTISPGLIVPYSALASNSDFGPLRVFGRLCTEIARMFEERIDNLYSRYSIDWVSKILPYALIVAYYGPKRSEIHAMDQTKRKAAISQGEDPTWNPTALQLVGQKVIRLPHQLKVANLLKDSPDFAVLPVDAGGGKSMLTITDILAEITANRNNPYLILCPGHLVPQYVKEFAFFTDGKVNTLPISTVIFNRHGADRLTKMIESAPRNTVVICGFDVLKTKAKDVFYGGTLVNIYPVSELLKQFSFGYVMCDESHYLKNDNTRSRAVLNLIADIPKKRLASGTMLHDSPSDLAMQIAIMDPTIFGDKDTFNERFGMEVKGGRVIQWKPGAQKEIMETLKSNVVYASAKRKEWAALLPPQKEEMFSVSLTPNQQLVYQAILTETLENLKKDIKLSKMLNEDGTVSEEDPDDDGEAMEAMLRPHLARLEQYITAPGSDALGKTQLSGEDLVSPKVLKIVERIRYHLDNNLPGKIIVFTNYHASADAIFNNLPPEIKRQTIAYSADNKVEDGAAFDKDDKMRVMIGVENSMNTGLNLQRGSRLIRTETVWNPGTLEQGNSRINRPELKVDDKRNAIYFDWIVADNTIDITKISRLISKTISIAKFENQDNPAYAELPDVPIIKINLLNIENLNSWESDLKPYAEVYSDYKRIMSADYAEYKEKFTKMYGNKFKFPVASAKDPIDGQLLTSVPYIPGLEIHGGAELGLIRVDEYLRTDDYASLASEDDDDSGREDGEDVGKRAVLEQMTRLLKDSRVHTEFGEGKIANVLSGGRKVRITLDGGYTVALFSSAVFLMDKVVNKENIRAQLLSAVDSTMSVAPELDADPVGIRLKPVTKRELRLIEKEKIRKAKEEEQKLREDAEALQVELQISISNGYLGITFFTGGESDNPAYRALQALGFAQTKEYYYAPMINHHRLFKLFDTLAQRGFTWDKSTHENVGPMKELRDLLRDKKLQTQTTFKPGSNKAAIKNFFRIEEKPSKETKVIKPYPLIMDGLAYVALPARGQVGSRAAIRVPVPGVKWFVSEPSLTFYTTRPADLKAKIKQVENQGLTILNKDELREQMRSLRPVKTSNR